MTAPDAVELLASTLVGLLPERQADVLEAALKTYVWAHHVADPETPPAEVARQFAALAQAATARAAELEATRPRRRQ